MITKFGSLYAGDVDQDNIGLDGTRVNDRWLTDQQLATVFDKARAIAQLMDRSGYETLWLAEHHFQREGYECIPNVLMLSLHLAHLTQNIKFGCGFNVTPMWNPLRLAEDFATADILTKGRVVFGVGRGYHTREVEVFGAPMLDADANRELFEEQVDIIFKAFNEKSFSHQGKHYTIPPRVPYRGYELEEITLVPRPLRLPVECWQPIVSSNPRGLRYMAERGMNGIIGGGAAPGGANEKAILAWREAQAGVGRETELGGNLIIGLSFYIADTEKKAMNEARLIFEEHAKMFAPLGFIRGLSDQQIEAIGDPEKAPFAGLPTIEDAVRSGAWLCGPPELIAERLMELQQRYRGLEQVNMGCVVGSSQRVILEQLESFSKYVMPEFNRQTPTPSLSD